MKVTLLTNIVAPYRFDSYCALHHQAEQAGGGLTVLCTNRSEPQRNWSEREGPFTQIYLDGLNIHLGENRNLALPSGVIAALRRSRPDILILVGFGIAQWRAQKQALQSAIPVIVQFDGWSGSDDIYCNPVRRYIRRQMVTRSDGFIAASSRGKNWFSAYGVAQDNIFISPIPTSFCRDMVPKNHIQRRFSKRHFDLMWCGRTTSRKGFDTFLDIACTLAHSNIIGKIGVVGCTDTAPIKNQLHRFNLADMTEIYGQLPPEHLPGLLTNAKLCLFPSDNDAYGLGVIEAISCGAVALASDALGCAPDILDPGETLVTLQPSAWASACSGLLDNPDVWDSIRQRQANRIKNNTAQHHAATLWHAICQMATKRQGMRQWN